MPDFAVANPRPVDLGSGLSQAGDNLVRVASIIEQRRQREEDMKTQAILGASQSDIGIYAPEVVEQLGTAKTREDRERLLVQGGQLATVRKQQHEDLIQKARAIQDAIAAGQDPNALVAEHQGQLTSSGLPGNLIASAQSNLGTQAGAGQARRGAVTEQRGYERAQQNEQRAYSEGRQLAAESRDDARWKSRFQAEQSAMDERANKAAERELDSMYQRKALELGLPARAPRAVVEEANARKIIGESQMTSQEVTANTGMANWLDGIRKSKKIKSEGGIDDVVGTLVDGIQRGGSTGGSLVPVAVKTNDGWFGSTWRVELKPFNYAQYDIDAIQHEAFVYDDNGNPTTEIKDPDAARIIGAYQEAVQSGKNRWVQRAVEPMSPEAVAATTKELGNVESGGSSSVGTPERASGARKVGRAIRGVGAAVGDAAASAFTPDPSMAGGAGYPSNEQAKAGKSAKKNNRALANTATDLYRGLTGK